jgi:ribosomal protein S18 acetylase RimI-like enzyme
VNAEYRGSVKLTNPADDLIAAWETDWRTRPGYLTVARRTALAGFVVHGLTTDDGTTVGVAAMAAGLPDRPREAVLCDLWVLPQWRRTGYGRVALRLVAQWALAQGSSELHMTCDPSNTAQQALFGSAALRSRHLVLPVSANPPALADGLTIEPMTAAEFPAWQERSIIGYARLATAQDPPTDAAVAISRKGFIALLPDGLATDGHELWTLRQRDRHVATLWLGNSKEETYVYDVEVDESMRGKGFGRQIMYVAEQRAMALGLPQVRLNVHEHNQVAVQLYWKLGYRPVTEFRALALSAG